MAEEMTGDEDRELSQLSRRLTQALQILDLEVDHALLLEVARKSALTVSPNAGAVSTFVVGYAAGLAATSGRKEADQAVRSAAEKALRVLDAGTEGPESKGWTDSGQ
jgi:hypothetical protein